ncbi:MAG: hypothetical protein II114_01060 [Treponema sp.]|nr:hypothetical protein [Treponema sp.]MBQ5384335.1 hypothetical protein [Treponema sp.]
MNVLKKSVSLVFISLLVAGSIYAQSSTVPRKPSGDEYWYILKQAQDAYEYSNFGQAISLAEQAKNKRKALIEWEKNTMDQAQRSSAVRLAGDDIKLVQEALVRGKLKNAQEIVDSYLSTYGTARFGGKFSNLLSFIERNSSYPEADYLIGKVYKLEGEIKKAEIYMKKAYEMFDLLSVPDVKYDILYDMADIAKNQLDSLNYSRYLNTKKNSGYYSDYEKYMTDILADDSMYSNQNVMNSMLNVISSKDKKSMSRFFELYRSGNDRSLSALIGLASYYRTSAAYVETNAEVKTELLKSLKCAALASIIAVTRIQDVLDDRLVDFSYTGIQDLLKKSSRYSDIVSWGNDNGVWELFCVLAETSGDLGYKNFSDDLFAVLISSVPEPYWKEYAGRKSASYK